MICELEDGQRGSRRSRKLIARLGEPSWDGTRHTRFFVKRSKAISSASFRRSNWTVRSTIQRYTRLSNGFVRKLENHAAATALNYFVYNFITFSVRFAGRQLWPLESQIGCGAWRTW